MIILLVTQLAGTKRDFEKKNYLKKLQAQNMFCIENCYFGDLQPTFVTDFGKISIGILFLGGKNKIYLNRYAVEVGIRKG